MGFTKMITTVARAGATIERAGRLLEEGVCSQAIAAQFTAKSRSGKIYSSADIESYAKVYHDCKSAVLITSKETKALLADQEMNTEGFQPA